MQSINTAEITGTVFNESLIGGGSKSGNNVTINQENTLKNFEGKVGKIPQNLGDQKTNNPEKTITELRAPTVLNRPRLNMDKALDTLWEIEYCIQDKNVQEQIGLKTESGFWGTLKNAFCKFLGFFSNSVKENRTNALNQQIDDVLKKICNNKDFYEKVLLPIMNDKDIDEELKTTCFRLFDNVPLFQKELFQKLNAPNADITFDVLKHLKKEIKNGKLFGKDVCKQWLSPLMNDETFSTEDKVKLYMFFDANPEIQDKLFKSLRDPLNEIKEKFWNKNEAKIKDGSFLGIPNPVKQWTKDEFMNVIGNPLSKILLSELEGNSTLEPSYFTKPETINLIHTEEDLKRFFKAHINLMNRPGYMDQVAKEIFEEYSSEPMSDKDKAHLNENVENLNKVLSGETLDETLLKQCNSQVLFSDLYRGNKSTLTFHFANNRKIKVKSDDCIIDGKLSRKVAVETIRKQIQSQKLTETEIKRLADFLGLSQGQGYWAPIRNEVSNEEHTFKMDISFKDNETEVLLPLDNNIIHFTRRFNSMKEEFHTLSENFGDSYDTICDSIPEGKFMEGTMKTIHEGTSLLNANEVTTFENFKLTVPDF